MADSRVVLTAYKEWAAVIRGLEEGDQICLLRKGPLREPRFSLERRRFWLLPTYAHQEEEKIQPPYRKYLDETAEHQAEAGEDHVRVNSWFQARTLITIRKNQRLNWLTDHTIYSPRCFQHRFQVGPAQAIHLLVGRAYTLSEPRFLQKQPDYSSCSAQDGSIWTELRQRIPMEAGNPAVSQQEFETRKEELRDRFVRQDDRQPDPLLF